MSPRVALPKISPLAWQHPDDRSRSRGRRSASEPLSKEALDRQAALRRLLLTDAIRVGPAQRPQLYALFLEVLETFGWPDEGAATPELYVAAGPAFRTGAFGGGIGGSRGFITVGARHVDSLDREEQRFYLARAVAEAIAASNRPQFRLAFLCGDIGDDVASLGDVLPFGRGVGASLIASEMSADRGGLLGVQDVDVALMTFLKLAGGNAPNDTLSVQAYIDQLIESESAAGDAAAGDTSASDAMAHRFSRLSRRRRLARRALDLYRWAQSAEYQAIVGGTYMKRGEEPVDTSAESQESSRDWFAGDDVRRDARAAVDQIGEVLDKAADSVGSAVNKAASTINDVFTVAAGGSAGGVGDVIDKAANAFRDAFRAAASAAKAAEERVDAAWRADTAAPDPVASDYESPASDTADSATGGGNPTDPASGPSAAPV